MVPLLRHSSLVGLGPAVRTASPGYFDLDLAGRIAHVVGVNRASPRLAVPRRPHRWG